MIPIPEQSPWVRSLLVTLASIFILASPCLSHGDQTPTGISSQDHRLDPVAGQASPPTSGQAATTGPALREGSELPPEPAPATESAPPIEQTPEPGYISAIGKTMDTAHSSLEKGILNQTVKFDNFFGDVHSDNLRQTKYELRWRNSLRVEHGWDLNFGTTVRANFVLSKISERLRLVIAGEDEPSQTRQSLPQDPGNPGFDRTTPAAHFANTELRYEFIQTPSVNLFAGAGVRITLPFEAFLRTRFQYTGHLSDVTLMRVAETFFVKNTDLLGETTEFSLERLFGKQTVLRWASAATASEEIEGVEWGTELSLLREISSKSALTLTGGLYGVTSKAGPVSTYRILARYRRNFLREWLFYELEPEISWPRDISGNYPATLAFTFRLEVVFKGSESSTLPKKADGSNSGH